MTINLGFVPISLTVTLTAGGGFASGLVADTPWTAGTVILLSFGDRTTPTPIDWPATIVGTSASWDMPAAAVTAVLTAGFRHVQLIYTQPNGERLVWGRGTINAG